MSLLSSKAEACFRAVQPSQSAQAAAQRHRRLIAEPLRFGQANAR
jgi:hypothetical protein